ncbi:MAG: hypothetical protein NUV74_14425 [Candidatus Brocadiaceae bacterium]|nr:hypothetical protein [Candidatus Brocadiaceae bacterium]
MTLKNNYLRLSKKVGDPYYPIKKGIKRGWIDSIMQGSELGLYKAYEISRVLGVSMEELYPGGPQADRISEHPELYALPEYPYSPEEQRYIGLLIEILRGENKKMPGRSRKTSRHSTFQRICRSAQPNLSPT